MDYAHIADQKHSKGVALMPPRSKVYSLPQEVRAELERRIVERTFSGYEDLAAWLQSQGFQIAEDSVQRHGARLRQKMESLAQSTQHAQAITRTSPKVRATLVEATIDLLNERIFSAVMEAEQSGHQEIALLSRTLADLSRMTIARQRWAEEFRARLEEENRIAQERGVKARRAEAFATTREALDAVKLLKAATGNR